jgi:YD repeat-containing protein
MLTLPDGEVIGYGYDASGAQTSLTAGGQGIVNRIERNARGQTIRVVYSNGVVTAHTYRETTDLRLESLVTNGPSGPIQSYQYGWDAVGNVTSIEDLCDEAATQACGSLSDQDSALYAYDSLGQLTARTGGGASLSYGYDTAGNLTNHAGSAQLYPAPGQQRPHAPTGGAPSPWLMTRMAT